MYTHNFKTTAYLLLLLASCSISFVLNTAHAQTISGDLNLDFENIDSSYFPSGWTHTKTDAPNQSLIFHADSTVRYRGRYSLCIDKTSQPASIFTSKLIIPLPDSGHLITLRGFIKTENVQAFAGLWMRIDGDNGPIALENMSRQRIQGTNDWKEYTITMPYDPKAARSAALGGIIAGYGKLWIDDLHIYINDTGSTLSAHQLNLSDHSQLVAGATLTATQIKDLARLGSLWGFLKYHHYKFTSGSYDADNELMRMIDNVYTSRSSRQTDQLFTHWLDSLGPQIAGNIPAMVTADTANSRCTPTYNILFNDKYFNSALTTKFRQILNTKNCSAGQYYASKVGAVTGFENEDAYHQIIMPSWYLRLLTLFRYWNVIEYFSPYRYLIDDWDAVLFKYIPVFFNARTKIEYITACQMLICEIKDAHSRINQSIAIQEGRRNIAPLNIAFIEGKPVIEDLYPAHAHDPILRLLHKGDIVTAIDGTDIDSLLRKYLPLTSGSNPQTRWRDVASEYLLRTKDTTIALTVLDASGTKTITVPAVSALEFYQQRFALATTEEVRIIEDSICYMPMSAFRFPYMYDLITDSDCTIKRVILDIRKPGHTQGLLDSVHFFIGMYATLRLPYCWFSGASYCYPGYFPPLSTNYIRLINPGSETKCPVRLFLLVDERVQSSAECITMALQLMPGATTIGTNTAGADGNITTLPLPCDITATFTSLGAYYPDGTETQQTGIKIDHRVERTINGIRQGKDELIEAASHL